MKKKELERQLELANDKLKQLDKKIELLSFIADHPTRCTLNVEIEISTCPTNVFNATLYGNCPSTINDWYSYVLKFTYVNKVSNNIEVETLLKSRQSFVITAYDFNIGTGVLSANILSNDGNLYKIKYNSYDRIAHPEVYQETDGKWIKLKVLEDTPRGRFLVI